MSPALIQSPHAPLVAAAAGSAWGSDGAGAGCGEGFMAWGRSTHLALGARIRVVGVTFKAVSTGSLRALALHAGFLSIQAGVDTSVFASYVYGWHLTHLHVMPMAGETATGGVGPGVVGITQCFVLRSTAARGQAKQQWRAMRRGHGNEAGGREGAAAT
jgi:hypothetical protein